MNIIFFRDNGLSPGEIVSSFFERGHLDLKWAQIAGRSVIYTHLGRIGNALLCKKWALHPGQEILFPAYNCGSEIDPFVTYGLKPVLYRLSEDLRIDLDDIKKRTTDKTKIIYVIHYFGWPQPLSDLQKFCRENNLYLVEDCALALFSRGEQGPLGTVGDAAIHSFRKTLPVPDGAALVFSKSDGLDYDLKPPPAAVIFNKTIPLFLRFLIHHLPGKSLVGRLLRSQSVSCPDGKNDCGQGLPDIPSDYYFDEETIHWSMSPLSSAILKKTDPRIVIDRRRKNFQLLLEGCKGQCGLRPLFTDLPPGVCPLLFPLRVQKLSKWIDGLQKEGIKAISWWDGYHQALSWEEFPEIQKLKRELLALPLHQYLTDMDVEYMVNTITVLARELS